VRAAIRGRGRRYDRRGQAPHARGMGVPGRFAARGCWRFFPRIWACPNRDYQGRGEGYVHGGTLNDFAGKGDA
jgi:hypothetical protein